MYLVLDLKEKDIKVIELKASILNMSVEQFVMTSTNRYNGNEDTTSPTLPTLVCGHCKSEVDLKPYAIPFRKEIGGKEYNIILRDFPSYKCSDCNTSYSDSIIQEKTDILLDIYLLDLVRMGKEVPNKLSFNELIQL